MHLQGHFSVVRRLKYMQNVFGVEEVHGRHDVV